MWLSDLLAGTAERCRRHAVLVVVLGVVLGALCALAAWQRLGVTTDTDKLFAETLPWRQRDLAFQHAFPRFRDLLVAVVDADEPEEAEATAAGLAKALRADPALFKTVRRPESSPWFEQNALMFLDPKPLQELMDRTIDAQPFLGQLVADPSARGLFAALTLVSLGVQRGEANLASFAPALAAFDTTVRSALDGHPEPLSWENLLAGPLAQLGGRYAFVLVHPSLDYADLEPGGKASDEMRRIIAGLPFVKAGFARVRITGDVALADEEFATVVHGALYGLIGSMLLVIVWLFLAVGSWRLILPILFTLMLGLMLTTGFAALAVGTLNLVSVAFAVLFIGIAVDFSIQFSVRYRSERQRTPDPARALSNTAGRVGLQILAAAAASAAGFLAFVPTAFAGVAELGLIAGAGMVMAFVCTLTFLPAGLTLLRPRPDREEVGFHWGAVLERLLLRVRVPVLIAFGALAVLGAVLLPRIEFDSDPLHTKNPHTEAMETLFDLMGSPLTNPYSADILAPDLTAADVVAARLRMQKLVGEVLTLSSFVPDDQPDKLAIIADAASILGPTLSPPSPAAPITPEDVRAAALAAHDAIGLVLPKLAPDDPLRALHADLGTLAHASDATAMQANDALVRFLPIQLYRLRRAFTARPVTAADVPPEVAHDWILPDGRARVQAIARLEASDSAGLHEFAREVRSVAPDAVGTGITIVDAAATIVGAFRTAALAALAAITVILALILRRALDVALVMAPLLLAALLTAIVVVLRPLPLNFANIIALPLLLGVGVSFNIYFVMNWRNGAHAFLGTATARAVMFSALTTGTAFGSLALSRHPGTASMGALLLASLGSTLAASLLFMPTLLGGMRTRPAPGAAVARDLHAPGKPG